MRIAIVLFDRFTALDAVGPYETLGRLPDAETVLVAERTGPVRNERGSLALVADRTLADVPRPDIVVVPGGPGQSAQMDNPVLLDWLRAADAACLPVLGICFGAQAIAAALGGSVHRLAAPEIGWIEIATADSERVPSGPWMSWHEDGFTPPPLAYELASNAVGTQAFCLRRHLAVQFHPEVTPDIVEGWATSPTSRLGETGQTVAGLRELSEEHAPGAAQRAERLFDGFAARAGIPPRVPR